jgi:hypothetical protein
MGRSDRFIPRSVLFAGRSFPGGDPAFAVLRYGAQGVTEFFLFVNSLYLKKRPAIEPNYSHGCGGKVVRILPPPQERGIAPGTAGTAGSKTGTDNEAELPADVAKGRG